MDKVWNQWVKDIGKMIELESAARDAAINKAVEKIGEEISSVTTAIDQLNALNISRRLIDIETRNEKPVETPEPINPAGTWTEVQNRAEGRPGRRRG